AAEQALAHLLDAHREHAVVQPGFHRGPRFTERGGAGRTGVGGIHYRNAGLADLLQDALSDHAVGLAEVATVQRLDVLNLQATVVEGEQRRLGTDLGDGLLGKPPELDHVDTNYVCVRHR